MSGRQTGGVTLQQAFDISQQGTQKEGTLHPRQHTKTHIQACIHIHTRRHTHTHTQTKPAPTDQDPAVRTGLITPHQPLPTTCTRVLTAQWVDAQPRGGPCVSIQQSEKQQHQWAHIIIHLTAPWAWHLLVVLLFRLSAALLPFSLHYSAQEKAAQSGGFGGLFGQQGTPPATLGHSVANIKYDWSREAKGSLTGKESDRSRCEEYFIICEDISKQKQRLCLPVDDSRSQGGSTERGEKRRKTLVCLSQLWRGNMHHSCIWLYTMKNP